jgi:hypothetical protein
VKSSDPIELSGFCDRVMVMSRGQIVQELEGDELTEHNIVQSIVGAVNMGFDLAMPAPTKSIEEQAAENAEQESP